MATPIILMILFHLEKNVTTKKMSRCLWRIVIIDTAVLGYFVILCVIIPFFESPHVHRHFPIQEFGSQAQSIWKEHYPATLCPMIGLIEEEDYKLISCVGIGMKDHPLCTRYDGLKYCIFHSDAELNQTGGMVFWTIDKKNPNEKMLKLLHQRYPNAQEQPPVKMKWKTLFGDFPLEIGVAIVPIPPK
jgi:hypothetical protein